MSAVPPLRTAAPPTTRAQLGAMVRALSVTAGRTALERSLPLYLALVIAAIMIFEGNGLEPAALLAMIRESTLLRVVMWSAWLLVTTPAAVAALASPSSFWLRSLPIPRWQSYAVQGVFMLIVELPWLVLWTRGGGFGQGIGAMATALCAHGLIVARLRRWPERALTVATVAVIVAPDPIWNLTMLPAGVFALRLAWLRAPERGRTPDLAVVTGPPTIALALAYVATFVRAHGSVLLRALLFTALASLLASLALLNGEDLNTSRRVSLAAGFFAPAAVIAGTSLSGPLRWTGDQARWLLASLGVSARLERSAGLLALAGTTTGFGLAHGLTVAIATGAGWTATAWVVVNTGLMAAALSGISAYIARTQRRPASMIAGLLILTALAIASTWTLGSWAAPAWAAAAMVMAATARARMPASSMASHSSGTRVGDHDGESPLLQVREVSKQLGRRRVLDAVSFDAHTGDVVVVMGDNGAGKSTLLRIIAGLLEPDRGTVRIGGHMVQAGGVAARRYLGYVPDTTDAFPELMVREFVELTRVLKRVSAGDDLLEQRSRLGLDGVWNQRLSSLSFGQRKRACVLTALLGTPPLLVLDEPSNGLDPEGVQVMLELVESRRADGSVTLLSTNDTTFARAVGGARLYLDGGHLTPEPASTQTPS